MVSTVEADIEAYKACYLDSLKLHKDTINDKWKGIFLLRHKENSKKEKLKKRWNDPLIIKGKSKEEDEKCTNHIIINLEDTWVRLNGLKATTKQRRMVERR